MKRLCLITSALLAAFSITSYVKAQETFQNLNFESATLPTLPAGQYGGFVSINSALPFWNAYLGTNQITEVRHNGITIGSASVGILGPNHYSSDILQGNYTVVLQAGGNPFLHAPPPVSASISQTGIVPADARSIQFRLAANPNGFLVTFRGDSLSPIFLRSGTNYQIYGVEISPFAGQSGELRFTASPLENYHFNSFFLDAIRFSTQPVPEPKAVALAITGAFFFGLHHWQKRRRNLQKILL